MKQITVILLLFTFPSLAIAYTMSGRVLRVDNGNTVTIVDSNNIQHTIRLQDVRVPGTNKIEGQQSLSNLQRLIGGKHVIVNSESRTDYKAPTGRVYLGETDINLKQIRDGMAKYQPSGMVEDKQIAQQYEAAQDRAKEENRGIWYTPRNRPGLPTYERRLIAPSAPMADAKQNYPPLPSRRHYFFLFDQGRNAEKAGSAAQYAPLADRVRIPYGHWAPKPVVPPPAAGNGVPKPPAFGPGYGPVVPPRVFYPQWQR
jgi:endonuclease YncB( thermonuclease family)